MSTQQKPPLTPAVLWLMAVSSGLIIANIYYNQPLLSLIAKDFHISESGVSKIPMLTQIGYALGLFFIVPLGDLVKRKQLIVIDMIFVITALLGIAWSQSITMLYLFSLLTGLTSVIPQVFVPMAASLAEPEKRTQSIGVVMSGLLLGILGSRVLSGLIANLYGWRNIYFIAAAVIAILWLIIIRKLPEVYPQYKGTYSTLMKSVWHYARTEPVLQAAALRGAFIFASFSAFWTSLVFHLEQPPFNAGSAVAGAFGIVGMAGALSAATIGTLSKKIPHFKLTADLIIIFLLSWGIFWLAGNTYLGLIIGVIILDMAVQATHIMNQSSIFNLYPDANSRMNTVYMTSYFIGGASGTYITGLMWQLWKWNGVLLAGAGFGLLALIIHFAYRKVYQPK